MEKKQQQEIDVKSTKKNQKQTVYNAGDAKKNIQIMAKKNKTNIEHTHTAENRISNLTHIDTGRGKNK